ncbi:MAG TPA: PTS system mannose/fructose/sorbose family transporter subunit IID, partial [Candidatus Onthosoma merdavium]|nr:PTS system mannose/fructose/sorbose family transporter subunit IID [Candidatus Onthosoma merdavium]
GKGLTYGINEDTVQSIFDGVMPNILPLGFVFLIYYLFKKKNMSVLAVILGIIVFGIAMSYLGWM